jgi:hypothetical protein
LCDGLLISVITIYLRASVYKRESGDEIESLIHLEQPVFPPAWSILVFWSDAFPEIYDLLFSLIPPQSHHQALDHYQDPWPLLVRQHPIQTIRMKRGAPLYLRTLSIFHIDARHPRQNWLIPLHLHPA